MAASLLCNPGNLCFKFVFMEIVVLAGREQKEELLEAVQNNVAIIWANGVEEFLQHPQANALVDLQFTNDEKRLRFLHSLFDKLVIINSVTETLDEINPSFVRFNGWPTFLSSSLLEGAGKNEEVKQKAEEVFSVLGKKIEWLPDEPGFITARVVSMIINEAFIALEEGVSTKEEINTAMKLGTNYPYGPFEWAEKIGVQNVAMLLQKLSTKQPRYKPAILLEQEAKKTI